MVNVTFAVSEDLHKRMRKQTQIKWGEVARRAIQKQVDTLEWMDEVLKDSELTEEDSLKIGTLINKSVARKHLREISKKRSKKSNNSI